MEGWRERAGGTPRPVLLLVVGDPRQAGHQVGSPADTLCQYGGGQELTGPLLHAPAQQASGTGSAGGLAHGKRQLPTHRYPLPVRDAVIRSTTVPGKGHAFDPHTLTRNRHMTWRRQTTNDYGYLRKHVSLRRKIDKGRASMMHTVCGVGYAIRPVEDGR